MFPRPGRIIVPEFRPPEGVSVTAAAELLGESKRAAAAQLIDLAVRGYITIARGNRRRDGFTLHLTDQTPPDGSTAASADERGQLLAIFRRELRPGSRRQLERRRNKQLGIQLRAAHRESVIRLIAGGYARRRGALEKFIVFWRKQPTEPTALARPIVDHLWGVRDYIAFAEKDRLAYLQSPRGALTRPGPDGELEILRLHEQLLPYAVLFGLETQWTRELDVRYRELADSRVLEGVVDAVGQLAGPSVSDFVFDTISGLDVILEAADVADGLGAFLGGLGEAAIEAAFDALGNLTP